MGYPLTEEVILELERADDVPPLVKAAMPAIQAALRKAFNDYDWAEERRKQIEEQARQRKRMLEDIGWKMARVNYATMGIAR